MTNGESQDLYNGIAMLSPQDFELRGSGLTVPLHFKPDASFILQAVLAQSSEFTNATIIKTPGFTEVCEGVLPRVRFASVFSDIRFTLNALGSTLILMRKDGNYNVYSRNPDYDVIDER